MAVDESANRYQGKPLLKLVESFVMKAIGSLEPSTEDTLRRMTPKLQQAYGRTGTWDEIVKAIMDLPPDIEAHIRRQWEQRRRMAANSGTTLSSEAFAIAYVDRLIADGTENSSL